MAGKILIVDDVATNRIVLKVKLATAHYETVQASGGVEALSLARSLRPDLVLLDVELPDMNGIEVLRKIKAEEQERKIEPEQRVTVIMVTVSSDEESILRCSEEGCDNYVMKPFNKLLVAKTISRFIGDATTKPGLTTFP